MSTPETTKPAKGTSPTEYRAFHRGEWSTASGFLIEEAFVTIYVNGRELVTMMATPQQQEYLAVGYLFTENLIDRCEEVMSVSLAPNQVCVDVLLNKELSLPPRRVLTSGCGKGVTFAEASQAKAEESNLGPERIPLDSDFCISNEQLRQLMVDMQKASPIHQQAGGAHGASLATPAGLLMVTEDVGRHNTLDKLAGRCLLEGINPADHILLSTGRISSEMLNKAYRMQIPIVASLSSPTSLSVQRANAWNMSLVGYLRPQRMRVYSHPERIL